ncbi:uncharacterized protein VTP21DRAFT_1196 [Calcarisporiella thermophila]|uniref:uncharacterized protein n=1 Tax=Calcarisporiella thermophila TaxID=911321 RepID=UPI003743D93F
MAISMALSLLYIFAFPCLFAVIHAHNSHNRPLSRLEFVSVPTLDILPREFSPFFSKRALEDSSRLQHDDQLRIHFRAYNQKFFLHLEPNTDFFHQDAVMNIHDPLTGEVTTKPLSPKDHLVYRGWVVEEEHSDHWWERDTIGMSRKSGGWEKGEVGWARIVVHNDGRGEESAPTFEGAFSHYGDIYHIKTAESYMLTRRSGDPSIPHLAARDPKYQHSKMVVYRDSDMAMEPVASAFGGAHKRGLISAHDSTCGMQDLSYNMAEDNIIHAMQRSRTQALWAAPIQYSKNFPYSPWDEEVYSSHKLFPRDPQPMLPPNSATSTCPLSRLVAYLGVAADCTYVQTYTNPEKARTQIITDFNSASIVYERTFNVALGITVLEINPPPCNGLTNATVPWNRDCIDMYDINQRLNDFSKWRDTRGQDGAALWHLMTKCGSGARVGIAWLGQLCNTTATQQKTENGMEWVSGTGVSSITRDEWKVVAHEVGHGFGAIHDCTAADCPCPKGNDRCGCCPLSPLQCDAKGKYLMHPTNNVTSTEFSPCAINYICSALPSIGSCLQPPSAIRRIEKLGMCGNGILEHGEECDVGNKQDDPCCIAATCKLKPGAVCSDVNSECCKDCQIKPAASVCRAAQSSCDIPEYCNGTSPFCPEDQRLPDGKDCGDGLKCASGQCTSRDQQCSLRGGLRTNVTKSCPSFANSCSISCVDPTNSALCISFNGNYIDGTPCGYGATCQRGSCQSGGVASTVLAWINENKNISIPAAIGIGLLLLLGLGCCVFRMCYRSKKRMKPFAPGGYLNMTSSKSGGDGMRSERNLLEPEPDYMRDINNPTIPDMTRSPTPASLNTLYPRTPTSARSHTRHMPKSPTTPLTCPEFGEYATIPSPNGYSPGGHDRSAPVYGGHPVPRLRDPPPMRVRPQEQYTRHPEEYGNGGGGWQPGQDDGRNRWENEHYHEGRGPRNYSNF